MKQAALATKYRPQSFSEVSGQQMITAILSRASAEDKIAPAYLFSGTRGVGKTTMARILAKAINCVNAPTAEPCNECLTCRQITAGNAVDVVEMDAASHGGVDNARRLKEDVAFAPMECRYKVFIIDEAHMLSTAAFNALLKTLEEPPERVTFIMATTEAHKFPATIISRCQHFIFKRLLLGELEEHLIKIVTAENVEFEPAAINLLARRAAGSVRDSMSMLGQVMALGHGRLAASDVRQVLGLAGPEINFRIVEAVAAEDCPALSATLREILDQGLDLGFFLRELGLIWRNMFLLRQAGAQAAALIDLPSEETALWAAAAEKFDLATIHSCWQMTLEAQRRVLTSLEPALALELFLFNLALLPRLLSMEGFSALHDKMTDSVSSTASNSGPESSELQGKKRLLAGDAPIAAIHEHKDESGLGATSDLSSVEPAGTMDQSSADFGETQNQAKGGKSWDGFVAFHEKESKIRGRTLPAAVLRMIKEWRVEDEVLHLAFNHDFQYNELLRAENFSLFEELAKEYFAVARVEAKKPSANTAQTAANSCAEPEKQHPVIVELQKELGAVVLSERTDK